MNEWVSVKKKQPIEGTKVTIWFDDQFETAIVRSIATDKVGQWELVFYLKGFHLTTKVVTHWMIPEPPGEENE